MDRPVIRPLTRETAPQAVELIQRVLRQEFSVAETVCRTGELGRFYEHYTARGNKAWTADVDGSVQAVVAAEEQPDGSLKMCRLYIEPAWRGYGLGRDLVNLVHTWAEEKGYQQIVLATFTEMHAARRLYESYGYREYTVEDRTATQVHRYRRSLPVRPIGARTRIDDVPVVEGTGLAVVVERPRGYLEGWHQTPGKSWLTLTEHYDRPVPVNYGFTPLWINPADGDALDVIILDDARMRPGQVVHCRPAGALWRPDDDHKLLAVPVDGAQVPVPLDDATKARVDAWWGEDEKPTGWGDEDDVETLLAACRHHIYKG